MDGETEGSDLPSPLPSLEHDGRDDVKRVGYSLTYDDAIFHPRYEVIQEIERILFIQRLSLRLFSSKRERERESEILFRISGEFLPSIIVREETFA